MQSVNDLQSIKKKVYMSYFEDGLWDLLLGIYLLAWGISIAFDMVAITGGVWVAVYFSVVGAKRAITYPRSGYIKIPEARKLQLRMLIGGIVLFVFGLVLFTLLSSNNRPGWVGEYAMFILGTLMCMIIAAMGYWWRVSRWFIVAGLLFLFFCLHQWTGFHLQYTFFIPGGVVALYGIYLFVKFLKKYPKSGPEGTDVIS